MGDSILSAGTITDIQHTPCIGLIAPITRAGTLVVDGVITSDYGPLAQAFGQIGAHAIAQSTVSAVKTFSPGFELCGSKEDSGKSPIMAFGQSMLKTIF